VPGVWVAGNVTDPMAQVLVAAGQGLVAGAAVHGDLLMEEAQQALGRARTTADFFARESWEERYAASDAIWSGQPNLQLVAEAADLTTGTALDVGCGEGADALWLAGRGWRVTGVDLSQVALDRAAGQSAREGLVVDWQQTDLAAWDPGVERYDLVSAQYFHWMPWPRQALFARLARAVRPGGTLLVVGHLFGIVEGHADTHAAGHDGLGDKRDLAYTAQEVADGLDPALWEVVVAESRPRERTDPHTGQAISIPDAVLRARRR